MIIGMPQNLEEAASPRRSRNDDPLPFFHVGRVLDSRLITVTESRWWTRGGDGLVA